MFAIRVRTEDYLGREQLKEVRPVGDFIKSYLEVLHVNKARFARFLKMKPQNLNKYLKGDSKLNAELAIKIATAFNLPPKLLLQIQLKNELFRLRQKDNDTFKMYSFEELLCTA